MPEPNAQREPLILAVSNQKGGEGKTTTAVNLAASLAAAERRVLLVDLDPQGNASTSVGFPRAQVERGIYEFIIGHAKFDEVVHRTELASLDLLPASPDLSGAEVEFVGVEGRETMLAEVLGDPALRARGYEFVILDCPPSLGLLTVNALAAATAVLIPMQAKYFSLEGLTALMQIIEMIRAGLNPELQIEGIVFCMFDPRTNLAQAVVADVESHFEGAVFETRIPINIRLSESPGYGKPALLYDVESKGAQAYLQLAQELLDRLEGREQGARA